MGSLLGAFVRVCLYGQRVEFRETMGLSPLFHYHPLLSERNGEHGGVFPGFAAFICVRTFCPGMRARAGFLFSIQTPRLLMLSLYNFLIGITLSSKRILIEIPFMH